MSGTSYGGTIALLMCIISQPISGLTHPDSPWLIASLTRYTYPKSPAITEEMDQWKRVYFKLFLCAAYLTEDNRIYGIWHFWAKIIQNGTGIHTVEFFSTCCTEASVTIFFRTWLRILSTMHWRWVQVQFTMAPCKAVCGNVLQQLWHCNVSFNRNTRCCK